MRSHSTAALFFVILVCCQLDDQGQMVPDQNSDAKSTTELDNGDESDSTDDGDGSGETNEETTSSIDNVDPTSTQTSKSETSSVAENEDSTTLTSSTTDDEHYKSGSRIRAKYIVGEDGSKQWIGWHDNKLNAACTYYQIGTKKYCLPTSLFGLSTGYFQDPKCTEPLQLALQYNNCPTPNYVILSGLNNDCVNEVAIFHVGEQIPAGTKYYIGSPSSCSEQTIPDTSVYYRIGGSVDLSAFVSAVDMIE